MTNKTRNNMEELTLKLIPANTPPTKSDYYICVINSWRKLYSNKPIEYVSSFDIKYYDVDHEGLFNEGGNWWRIEGGEKIHTIPPDYWSELPKFTKPL